LPSSLTNHLHPGTVAFLRSISLEAVGLGVHLAAGAHDILLQAEYILARIPPSPWALQSRANANVRSNQPKDAQHGIKQVYIYLMIYGLPFEYSGAACA